MCAIRCTIRNFQFSLNEISYLPSIHIFLIITSLITVFNAIVTFRDIVFYTRIFHHQRTRDRDSLRRSYNANSGSLWCLARLDYVSHTRGSRCRWSSNVYTSHAREPLWSSLVEPYSDCDTPSQNSARSPLRQSIPLVLYYFVRTAVTYVLPKSFVGTRDRRWLVIKILLPRTLRLISCDFVHYRVVDPFKVVIHRARLLFKHQTGQLLFTPSVVITSELKTNWSLCKYI